MGLLYLLTFPNGKRYVGQTQGTVEGRLGGHRCAGSRTVVGKAVRRHGDPTIEVLLESGDRDELDRLEIKFIDWYDSQVPAGYNVDPGGRTRRVTAEERRAMSQRARAQGTDAMHSPEAREKKSASMKERWRDPEHREKVAKARKGKKNPSTPSQRANQSAAAKRRWANMTPEAMEAYRESGRRAAAKRWGESNRK